MMRIEINRTFGIIEWKKGRKVLFEKKISL